MDFIKGLPLSKGHNVILVVVDRFTKFAHFLPLKHPFSASQVAKVFLNNVASLYGMPKSIVSDRDRIFTSHFWQTLFKRFGIPLNLTAAYHPQSDGQTERVNQCRGVILSSRKSRDPPFVSSAGGRSSPLEIAYSSPRLLTSSHTTKLYRFGPL